MAKKDEGFISSGLRRAWEVMLKRASLSGGVKVIAEGRILDGYVVSGAVKAALDASLQVLHKPFVWEFGDSARLWHVEYHYKTWLA
jgi:hypothetical protein